MFTKIISLEWKAFLRSPALTGNVVLTIFKVLGALYFITAFLALGIGGFYILNGTGQDPLVLVNKYMIYYMAFDLFLKLMVQKLPVLNIRPMLTWNIKRGTIINYAIGKTLISFFNVVHLFFLVPFTIVLAQHDYGAGSVTLWFFGIMLMIYANNFLNILLSNKDGLLGIFTAVVAAFAALQYFNILDITLATGWFYQSLYSNSYFIVIPVLLLAGLWYASFRFFNNNLFLDAGLSKKHAEAQTEDYSWLNRYGTLGTFLKNDIRMIRRNKRARGTLLASFLFLFYGLLFFSGAVEAYDSTYMKMFAAIFITGGFLFTFGQFVPSWDSAYYPLMMSQNIRYREYIAAKWWMVVIGTVICTVLASFYLYFGWETYLMIIAAGIFNIGFNSHIVLLGGAYVKTPIDLTSGRQAFGDKKAFNIKTMLLSLPKLILPCLLYLLGEALIGQYWGTGLVILAGILGFALRNTVFSLIEKIYKAEKYSALHSYKTKS